MFLTVSLTMSGIPPGDAGMTGGQFWKCILLRLSWCGVVCERQRRRRRERREWEWMGWTGMGQHMSSFARPVLSPLFCRSLSHFHFLSLTLSIPSSKVFKVWGKLTLPRSTIYRLCFNKIWSLLCLASSFAQFGGIQTHCRDRGNRSAVSKSRLFLC